MSEEICAFFNKSHNEIVVDFTEQITELHSAAKDSRRANNNAGHVGDTRPGLFSAFGKSSDGRFASSQVYIKAKETTSPNVLSKRFLQVNIASVQETT